MRPGSVNVIFITFGGFTLLDDFSKLFEALTTGRKSAGGRLWQLILL
jgi:hypothetical protein